jgi:hypothetical protein
VAVFLVVGTIGGVAVLVTRGFGRVEAVQLAQLQGHVFID